MQGGFRRQELPNLRTNKAIAGQSFCGIDPARFESIDRGEFDSNMPLVVVRSRKEVFEMSSRRNLDPEVHAIRVPAVLATMIWLNKLGISRTFDRYIHGLEVPSAQVTTRYLKVGTGLLGPASKVCLVMAFAYLC